MTIEVDYLPFATGAGANVLSQEDWVALAAVSTGFTAGEAYSAQLNKAWRQSGFVAANVAQYMATVLQANILDDGNQEEFITNLWQALLGGSYFVDTGSASALLVANPTAPIGSLTFPAPIAGLRVTVKAANACIGATTFNWMGTGAVAVEYSDGSAVQDGDYAAGAILDLEFNGTLWQFVAIPLSAIRSRFSFGSYQDYITATGAGNWTAPFTGVIDIEGWGGGGGSSGSSSGVNAINGAGAGAYFLHQMSVTEGTEYPYAVAAGGSAAAYGSTGGTGGTTTWNSTVSATGGTGSSYASDGSGGTATGASVLNLSGAPGNSFGTATGQGGTGGSAPRGGGGGATGSGAADGGSQPGGGAGGPGAGGSETGQAGGNGAILIRRVG